jgi:hypothetical protein
MGSRSVTLQFESKYAVCLHDEYSHHSMYIFAHADAVTEALNRTMVTTVNSSVTLSCEVYGYLPRASEPRIIWRRMNGGTTPISSSPPYMITTSPGSRHIQNGGDSPIPSVVSSLIIDVMDDSVADMYMCSGPSNFETIQLIVEVDGGGPGMYNEYYIDLLTS